MLTLLSLKNAHALLRMRPLLGIVKKIERLIALIHLHFEIKKLQASSIQATRIEKSSLVRLLILRRGINIFNPLFTLRI